MRDGNALMPARKYSDAEVADAVEMREAGVARAEIARRLGMSIGAVDYHCLRLGAVAPAARIVPSPPRTMEARRGDHVVRRFSPAEDARLLKLEAAGIAVNEIARRLGRPANSVRGRLQTLARHEALQEAET